MEEVDNIIIRNLREVGCEIEEEIDSLKQFTTELVVEAAVRCLEVIQPGLGLPHSVPPSLSARYRLGADIAQACKALGYSGDIGYQTFLYSSETDVRRVFMFLIEKLLKETEKIIVEPSDKAGLLETAVSQCVKSQLTSPWVPSFCRRRGVRWRDDGSWSREGYGTSQPFVSCSLRFPHTSGRTEELSQTRCEYFVHYLPLVSDQVQNPKQLLPSLIALNSEGLTSEKLQVAGSGDRTKTLQRVVECVTRAVERCSPTVEKLPVDLSNDVTVNKRAIYSRFRLSEKLQFTKEEAGEKKPVGAISHLTGVDRRKGEEEELEKAKEETERLRERLEALQMDIKKLNAKAAQMTEENSIEERLMKDKKERFVVKKRTYDLLPEADQNLKKLQSLVESSAQKLVGLASQWEKHRVPLLEHYRMAKERNSNKASESQKKADAVRSSREKVRELNEELRSKEQLYSQLVVEYEKVTKDINRSAYTRRIMEIIGNIRKQKEEIDKVLKDTKELQKEINNLTGQVDRSFTVADELIFGDAKKDEVSRRAYKLLATLHSDCGEVVQMVEETGATIREIRDLEEQIESETAKNVGANLERISADLKQMKQESAALTAQLNSKS